jgi:hypothetical protein
MTDSAAETIDKINRLIRDLNAGAVLSYDGPEEYWSTRMGVGASIEVARLLSAALAHPGQVREIAIKPLEWGLEPGRAAAFPRWNATVFGETYSVFKAWWGKEDKWGFVFKEFHHSAEAAKAAAQADYEQRIRSALVLPLPVQESEPVAYLITTVRTGETRISTRPVANLPYNRDRFISQPLYLHPETASVREGWRPIETAPKDGSVFLAVTVMAQKPTAAMCKRYDNKFLVLSSGEKFEAPGWTQWWPTHWMPLPSSPTDGQTGGIDQ